MVRTYKRTSTRRSYGIEALKKAVDGVVKGKLSKNKAELIYA